MSTVVQPSLTDAEFSEARFELLLPVFPPELEQPTIEDLLAAPERSYALYDERLTFYLVLRLPERQGGLGLVDDQVETDEGGLPKGYLDSLSFSVECVVTEMTSQSVVPFSPFLAAPPMDSPALHPPRRSSIAQNGNGNGGRASHSPSRGPGGLRGRGSFTDDGNGGGSGDEMRVSARTMEHAQRKARRMVGRRGTGWVVGWEVRMELDYMKSAGKAQNLSVSITMGKAREGRQAPGGPGMSSGESRMETRVLPSTTIGVSMEGGEESESGMGPGSGRMMMRKSSLDPGMTGGYMGEGSSSVGGNGSGSAHMMVPGGRKASLLSVLTSRSVESLLPEGAGGRSGSPDPLQQQQALQASLLQNEEEAPGGMGGAGAMLLEGFGAEDHGLGEGAVPGGVAAVAGKGVPGEGKDGEKMQVEVALTSPGGAPSRLGRRPSLTSVAPMLRRTVRRTIPIRPAVSMRATSTWTSLLENTFLLSVDLANEKDAHHTYVLYDVDVDISNAAVRYLGQKINKDKPEHVGPREQYSSLYHVKLLDEATVPVMLGTGQTTGNPPPPRSPISGSMMSPLFSPTVVNPHLRDVVIGLEGAALHGEGRLDGQTRSEWRFPLDVSDVEKRRVQELFKGNGPRTRMVWPPPDRREIPPSLPSPRIMPFGAQRRPTVVRATSDDVMEGGVRRNTDAGGGGRGGGGLAPGGSGGPAGGLRVRTGGLNNLSVHGMGGAGGPGTRPASPLAGLPTGGMDRGFPGAATRKKAFTLVGGPSHALSGTTVGAGPGVQGATEFGGGVVVSFSVGSKVVHGQVFAVEAFLVNRSARIKNFTVSVPARQRGQRRTTTAPAPTLQVGPKTADRTLSGDMHVGPRMKMGSQEVVSRYVEGQRNDASLLSVDTHIRLSPLMPASCQSVHLRFKPYREGFNMVELIQLYDNDTGTVTSLRDVVEVYVHPVVGA